jgi:two-component system chemotaxis response regulator CheY
MRALIVDDSRPIRHIAARTLQELGFETADACDGKDALARLDGGEAPDVALIDWNMPEMNGLELVQTMRKDARFSGTALIMVTTETEPEQMVRALNAGADEYLMKPFEKASLIEKLRLVGVLN